MVNIMIVRPFLSSLIRGAIFDKNVIKSEVYSFLVTIKNTHFLATIKS